jgi:hypothetical protein
MEKQTAKLVILFPETAIVNFYQLRLIGDFPRVVNTFQKLLEKGNLNKGNYISELNIMSVNILICLTFYGLSA